MTNEQHIENLKKLKSFHNGSYGADIDRAIKALKQEPCEDCISRQAVLDEMMLIPIAPLMVGDGVVYKKGVLEGTIKALPSVTPNPKTGKWIYKSMKGNFCSECDEQSVWNFNYCPNCGAKMEVSE